MKNIAILGSTGSIGQQALDVIRNNREDFAVAALCCDTNIEILEQQIREFNVKTVAVCNKEQARNLKRRVDIEVLSGLDGVVELAKLGHVDLVLNSLVGSIGIRPTISAITSGKNVALANKETLVSAGEAVMALAKKHRAFLFPVDSEHSAIFQCLNGEKKRNIKKLIITCSGGAFRDRTKDELHTVTAGNALKHPNWNMGEKITIDSATLINKGFEVIEARMLFDVDYDDIQVVVHPQSIIHSLVEFVDNSLMAQLSCPDMRIPIQYALTYPERAAGSAKPLDLTGIANLTFSAPDPSRFPCLAYAIEAGKIGGTLPCVLNAANEIAVKAFLAGRIGFLDIPDIIRRKLDGHEPVMGPGIDEILAVDEQIKRETSWELDMDDELVLV